MELSARPYETWYGWEGDRLTTVQTQQNRIQTVYAPGSFTPLVRIETDSAEQAKARHRSLAEKLEQEGCEDGQGVKLPAALRGMLDRLEGELRRNAVSEESRQWLAGCGLTVEQMAGQLEPHHEPERKVHLYHCDQRGLPLALISTDNTVAWRGEYDEWGNLLGEENPEQLEQLIRLPGQQYDEESGLYYNRHRYYNPGQGRYITQDPIGLEGGWNLYQYPLNPVEYIDPLGLSAYSGFGSGFDNYVQAAGSLGTSMAEQGVSPEDLSAAFKHMAKGDLPKQARQFIEGWVYGSASYASVIAVACLSTPLAVSGALTGGANALNQIWNGGDFSFSDTYVATNVGVLTEGRGLLATTGINVAGYSISNIIKGTAQTVEGVASTVFGTITGFGTTKGLGTAVGSNISTGVGAVVTEVTTSQTNERLNE
jgi:RHS repeat-associated protein